MEVNGSRATATPVSGGRYITLGLASCDLVYRLPDLVYRLPNHVGRAVMLAFASPTVFPRSELTECLSTRLLGRELFRPRLDKPAHNDRNRGAVRIRTTNDSNSREVEYTIYSSYPR